MSIFLDKISNGYTNSHIRKFKPIYSCRIKENSHQTVILKYMNRSTNDYNLCEPFGNNLIRIIFDKVHSSIVRISDCDIEIKLIFEDDTT